MTRPMMKNDIPEHWTQRAKAGLCPVCGKDPSEFEKNMRVYCSVKCREEYASKYVWWTDAREKILKRDGRFCAKRGITPEDDYARLDIILKNTRRTVILENKDLIESYRHDALIKLSEDFEKDYQKIMDDDSFLGWIKHKLPDDARKKLSSVNFRRMVFEVDHIKAICNGGDPWDEDNLQVLCKRCHKAKTKADLIAKSESSYSRQ